MAILEEITVDWDVSPRIVNVNSGTGELTIQDLYDKLRYLASQPDAMDDAEIVDAGGKEGGVVAITMTLKNAQIKFQDTGTPRLCKVLGGNLFALDVDGYDINPIAYNTNVTATFAQSTAAALVQDADIDTIMTRIGVPTSTLASGLDDIQSTVNVLHPELKTEHGSGLWEKRRGIFK